MRKRPLTAAFVARVKTPGRYGDGGLGGLGTPASLGSWPQWTARLFSSAFSLASLSVTTGYEPSPKMRTRRIHLSRAPGP